MKFDSSVTPETVGPDQIGLPPPGYRLPPKANIGRVRIAVSNLERAVAFYSDVIGLAVLDAGTANAKLALLGANGSDKVLLELEEIAGVQPLGKRTRLGLYHTAFLLPDRMALSGFVQHLSRRGVPFGSGDHIVSEALYLTDPDGLTVEVYSDRPRSAWRVKDLEVQVATGPLRFDELPAVPAESWQGAPAGTTVGHVHFYVNDLKRAASFYHAGVGFDRSMVPLPSALFMGAGGYHHHVGANVWAAGSPVASERDARLLFWELALPDAAEIERVAASMNGAGFIETTVATGARAFTDACGITVALTFDHD